MSAIAWLRSAPCASVRPCGLYADQPPAPVPPRWLALGAVLVWLIGCGLRAWYVLIAHPPTAYLYSDMQSYADTARRMLDPQAVWGIGDSIYPPGNAWWLALWRWIGGDTTWLPAVAANLALSCLTPLLLAATVKLLLGGRTAAWVLMATALWWPFIDQAGYFLAETPFTAAIAGTLLLTVAACRASGGVARGALGLAAGAALAGACAIKGQALIAGGLVGALLIWDAWRRPRLRLVVGCMLLAWAAALTPVSLRATALAEGRFTLISSNGATNLLQGHYGWDAGHFRWEDSARGLVYAFGNPATLQKRREGQVVLPFGVYDQDANAAEAWRWIRAYPLDAFLLSCDNVITTLHGTVPWPSSHTRFRVPAMVFETLHLVLVLLPVGCFLLLRGRSLIADRHRGELLILLPWAGCLLSAFLLTGDPRYRIPFDLCSLVLAVRCWMLLPGWRRRLLMTGDGEAGSGGQGATR
jgi:hypothetical protein